MRAWWRDPTYECQALSLPGNWNSATPECHLYIHAKREYSSNKRLIACRIARTQNSVPAALRDSAPFLNRLSPTTAAIVRRHHLGLGCRETRLSWLAGLLATSPDPSFTYNSLSLSMTRRSISIYTPGQVDMNSQISRHLATTLLNTETTASSSRPTLSVTLRTTKGTRRRPSR